MISVVNGSGTPLRMISLGVGVAGLTASVVGWIVNPRAFFVAYLFAIVFFVGLSLGALGFLMMHHLTGGFWGYGVRRFLEAAIANLPLMGLMFVPIFFGLHYLYGWTNPAAVAASEVLQKKIGYLTMPGFIVRTIVNFAIWIVMAHFLLKWSAEQDVTVSVEPTRKMRTLSGPGLVIYPLSMTVASVDWLMSLEPFWYSTMFPVLICIGQMLSALAFVILLLADAARSAELGPLTGEDSFHKLGNLLLAFTMLWAYLAFGQLLIIWSGNLPDEIRWYLHRVNDGWRYVAGFIALFQFFLPFFLLLMRPIKKRRKLLARVAVCVFLSHIVTVWWTVAPSFHSEHLYVDWLAFAALLGVAGIWFAAFLWNLERRSLVPLNDPRFALSVPA
jgi:hypothetical protein